jgi:hypothetical protein
MAARVELPVSLSHGMPVSDTGIIAAATPATIRIDDGKTF